MVVRSELQKATAVCRTAFIGVAILSGAVNLLYLTGSFYMLEIYDRVVPSRSVATLVGISLIAAFLFIFQGLLEIVRNRILARAGGVLDARLSARIFDIVARLPLRRGAPAEETSPLRDLDQIRSFALGNGAAAFFDLPWIPLYLCVCFAFHPLIGFTAFGGAAVLFTLAVVTERASRRPAIAMARAAGPRLAQAEAIRSNAEAVRALGMGRNMNERWSKANDAYRTAQQKASDVVTGLGGLAKSLRMMLQAAVLGLGAWLVIHDQATGGIIIASSILTSRALAPVELAIANWRGFVAARQSWGRLTDILVRMPESPEMMELPPPSRTLKVEKITVAPPGSPRSAVNEASFELEAGHAVGVIGPSASGKSSLARAITGVWLPDRGTVRLDGATLDQWNAEALGKLIGYLPQDLELFSGTVRENIARFAPEAPAATVIAAAEAAGVHELILALPNGYETEVGEGGALLSAGQKQRIALARALYGDPFLVVLDEPNSNLDAEGERALCEAIAGIRARAGIAVVIAHRPSALAACNLIMMIANGRIVQFGAKEEVLRKVLQQVPSPSRPARVRKQGFASA